MAKYQKLKRELVNCEGMMIQKISIAMATYNGEQHISEQLQSLAAQTHLPDELVVGDDGSTDATLDIIEGFSARAPFPVRIYRNETNLGYARNFLATAKRCQGDWVAFCDQDDFWLPTKLAETANAINHTPDCCMVLQNAWLCDGALLSHGRKFPDKLRTGFHARARQYGFWVWLGFLQTVHRDIIDLFDNGALPRNYFSNHAEISHDKWTCLIANALGGIVVLGDPVALYRRHEAALTGNYNRQSLGERVAKARAVVGEHYDFFADVAEDCAHYMQGLAERTDNAAWATAFRDNSNEFRHLSKIQQLRGRLYAAPRFRQRLSAALKIARDGGYSGQPFHAMGLRSAAKDLARIAVGPRL